MIELPKSDNIEMAGPWVTEEDIAIVTDMLKNGWYGKNAYIKLFSDNWPKLRDGKLKSKAQGKPELPTRKRTDLLEDRMLSMNDPATAAVINKITAHDFSSNSYTVQLKKDDKLYTLTLKIEEKPS